MVKKDGFVKRIPKFGFFFAPSLNFSSTFTLFMSCEMPAASKSPAKTKNGHGGNYCFLTRIFWLGMIAQKPGHG
jgi:hypothetical protein